MAVCQLWDNRMKIGGASNHTPGAIICGYLSRIERVAFFPPSGEHPPKPLRERTLLGSQGPSGGAPPTF